MPITKSTTLKFYKRREIQEALVEHARNKEVGFCYGEGYGKRPDVLLYPRDVLELALKGLTSFHASEELWSNPLTVRSEMSRKDLDGLRTGWDLVLDIDCKIVEYSALCADLVIRFLKYNGVQNISVKFSGNKGFHIGVPFEAFPKQVGNILTKDLFPEAPRKIALYVKENIKEELGKSILAQEGGDFSKVIEKVHLSPEKIIRYERSELGGTVPKLHVDAFLEIDTVLLASRHLYRMPYSLHEKSGLVSLPIDPSKVLEFRREMAQPEKILAPMFSFLDRTVEKESAGRLLLQALDFKALTENKKEEKNMKRIEEVIITSPIQEDFFPPCIQKILTGMEDGKKRSVFILMNFLGKLGWNKEDIQSFLMTWNKDKNREPLREVYIKGQLHHFTPGDKLPPNCDNEAYYTSLGICCNAQWCKRYKNPVNYTLSKWKRHLREKSEEEERLPRKRKKKEDSTLSPPTPEKSAPDTVS